MSDNTEQKISQWAKKTDEQKAKQMEYNRIHRYTKKAKELGITLEEYEEKMAKRKEPKARVAKVKAPEKLVREAAENQYKDVDNSDKPDEIEVVSPIEPWITFKLRKHTYKSKAGAYVGYKVYDKIVDNIMFDKMNPVRWVLF